MAWVALAGVALSAISSMKQGESQHDWAEYQADQMRADAAADQGLARVQAKQIRAQGDRQRGSARAAMAASGINVDGIGTPTIVDKGISQRSEHDAFLTLLGADDRARRTDQQAYGAELQGDQARSAGYMGAGSSLLSAGGKYGQQAGWFKRAA